MNLSNDRKIYKWWIGLLCTIAVMAVVLFVISRYFVFIFTANDDLFMRAIISGDLTGTPDGHAIFMLYPLAKFLSLLYRIFPSGSWYGIFFLGMHVTCWGLLLYRAILLGTTKYKQICLGIATITFLLMVDLENLVHSQFTTLAGIIAFTALFWFVTEQQKEKLHVYILEIILLCIALMLRYEIVLMYVPFFALFGIFQLIHIHRKDEKKEMTKKVLRTYIFIFASIALLFGGIYGVHKSAYSTNEWKEYKEFNDLRSMIYDYYYFPEYEENVDFYNEINIQTDEMYVFKSINISLNDNINTEMLRKILEKSKEIKKWNEQFYSVPRKISLAYIDTLLSPSLYVLFLYFLYGAALSIAFIRKNVILKYQIFCLFVLRSILWIHLIIKGRLLERVTYPLILAEIAFLLGIICLEFLVKESNVENGISHKKSTIKKIITILVGCFICSVFCFSVYKKITDSNTDLVRGNQWSATLFSYIEEHPENYYLLDTASASTLKAPLFGEDTHFPQNATMIGGWLCKVPIIEEQRSEILGDTIENALVLNDSVLFIQNTGLSIDWIGAYLNVKHENITVEIIDSIDYRGASAYSIIRVNNNNEQSYMP